MHLNWNSSAPERCIVGQGLLDTVHIVVLVLQQERRRGLTGDVRTNIWLHVKTVPGKREMSGINRYCKVWAAAFFVGGINGGVETLLKMDAHRCDQVSACGKPKDANLMRIDVPLRSVKANQTKRSLRIF
jgi:hypothetical protein